MAGDVRTHMLRRFLSSAVLALWIVCSSSALAQEIDPIDMKRLAEPALKESEAILVRGLSGHYDVTQLKVLKIERIQLNRDYPLVRAMVQFAARRNATRSSSFNEDIFRPGHPMCQGWLFLHCGVPVGHVFEGQLELMLALDRTNSWFALAPRWRSRSSYALDGYLVLDGREKEGYVLFPK